MGFERQQFTFYRSFLNIIEQLPDRKQREFMLILIRYALNETEPVSKDSTIRAAFEGLRPILDKARNKAKSGKTGGETSGESRKQIGSKREANRSKREAEGEKQGEKEIEIQVEGEEEGNSLPPEEETNAFPAVFERLRVRQIFLEDKEREECRRLCEEYGSRSVLQAIERAKEQNVPRWSYIRAIITSGGVNRPGRDTWDGIRHGEPMSPLMLRAVRDMMAEGDGEEAEE